MGIRELLVVFFVVVVFNDLGTGAKFITDERALECMLVCSSKRKKKKRRHISVQIPNIYIHIYLHSVIPLTTGYVKDKLSLSKLHLKCHKYTTKVA